MQKALRNLLLVSAALCISASNSAVAHADDPQKSNPPVIKWIKGPTTAKLGTIAEIDVPEGCLVADGEGARKFLELTHNPTSGAELGIVVPQSEKETWFVLFEFSDVGYVKDDDKGISGCRSNSGWY